MDPLDHDLIKAIVQGAVKPFNTAVKEVSKGCGKLTDLAFARLKTDNEIYEMESRAASALRIARMKAEHEQVTGAEFKPDDYYPLLHQSIIQGEMDNLAGNLRIAANILQQTPDEEVSDEKVSPDWFARWRKEATITSNESMQQLWGKILAEEIKQPSSFSYRTLDTLKNISPAEAQLFVRLAPFVYNNETLISKEKFRQESDHLNDTDILILADCRLLASATPVEISLNCNRGDVSIYEFTHFYCRFWSYSVPSVSFEGYTLSSAAKEILPILPMPDLSKDDLHSFAIGLFCNYDRKIEIYSYGKNNFQLYEKKL